MSGIARHLWNLSGQQFGRWTVISFAGPSRNSHFLWNCKCSCGTKRVVMAGALRQGRSLSCGCLTREIASARQTHGHTRRQDGKATKSRTYRCWQNMHMRCYRPTYPKFHNYGGRGIRVCERWHTFENFLADMGQSPPGLTIERINNAGNYEPGNCRWATYQEQNRNFRRNHVLTAHGETLILDDWARRLGVAPSVITGRIQRGWSIEEAVTFPAGKTHLARRRADHAREVTYQTNGSL